VSDPKLAERITAAVLAELNKPSEAPAPPPRVYTSAELWDSAPKGVYKREDGYDATAVVFYPWDSTRAVVYVSGDGVVESLARGSTKWLPDQTREARVTFVPAGGAA